MSEDCELGYFDQDLAQKLPLDKTGLEYVLDVARVGSGIGSKKATITDQMARSALGIFRHHRYGRYRSIHRRTFWRRESASRVSWVHVETSRLLVVG